MGPEEGSLALEKLCGLAFVSRAQGRGGIGMMTTGVSIPLGSFNVPGLLLAAVLAVILNLVLPKESQGEKPVTATTAADKKTSSSAARRHRPALNSTHLSALMNTNARMKITIATMAAR